MSVYSDAHDCFLSFNMPGRPSMSDATADEEAARVDDAVDDAASTVPASLEEAVELLDLISVTEVHEGATPAALASLRAFIVGCGGSAEVLATDADVREASQASSSSLV